MNTNTMMTMIVDTRGEEVRAETMKMTIATVPTINRIDKVPLLVATIHHMRIGSRVDTTKTMMVRETQSIDEIAEVARPIDIVRGIDISENINRAGPTEDDRCFIVTTLQLQTSKTLLVLELLKKRTFDFHLILFVG